MTQHFNQLSNGEAERLAMLAEEAAEIIQIVGKILRHGYESHHPKDPSHITNRATLEYEIADLKSVVAAMGNAGDIDLGNIDDMADSAWQRKLDFTHHQEVDE